jgi:hypothetical protein
MIVPKLEVLPPAQRRLWDEFDQVPRDFVLYGGTALALRLAHRQSADFDFFGSRHFDPQELARSLGWLREARITQQKESTLSVILDRGGVVKVSFFGLPDLKRLEPPDVVPTNGLQVASLLDLSATKAAVVQARAEAKDYLDLDALLKTGMSLSVALAAAQAVYGPPFNPLITLKALSYFADGNLDTLPPDVQDRLATAARAVDLDLLPAVELRFAGNAAARETSRGPER